MKNFYKNKFLNFILIWYLLISLIGFFIMPTWLILMLGWSILVLITFIFDVQLNLNSLQKLVYKLIIIIYPFLETVIKYMLINNTIPYSWNWLNPIEHFMFSFGITILIMSLVYKFFDTDIYEKNKHYSVKQKIFIFIIAFGLVNVFGIFNEYFEFVLREYIYEPSVIQLIAYYGDTIKDLFVNMIGAVISGLVWLSIYDK